MFDKYVDAFQNMSNPIPSAILKWLSDEGITQKDIGSTLSSLAQTMIEQDNFVEAFWALMTFKSGIENDSIIASIDRMLSFVKSTCISAGKKWLQNEIECQKEDIPFFECNIENNLTTLIMHHPALCTLLLKSSKDRHLSIECISQNNSNNLYRIKDIGMTGEYIGFTALDTKFELDIIHGGICCFGIGSGHEIRITYNNTFFNTIPNLQVGIFIFELSFSVLKANLAINDMCEMLKSERVFWFIGYSGWQNFENYYNYEDQLSPSFKIFIDPVVKEAINPKLEQIYKIKLENCNSLRKLVDDAYDKRSDIEWHNIYNGNRPLRIMGLSCLFTSYLQYCMRDILDGFRELGCEVKLLIEKAPILRCSKLYNIKEIKNFSPDLIIRICYNRIDSESWPYNIPYINWQQDKMPHNSSPEAARSIQKKDLIVAARYNCNWLLESGFPENKIKSLTFWPTNTKIYHPIVLSNDELKKYKSEFSYISHNNVPPEHELDNAMNMIENNDKAGRDFIISYYEIIKDRFLRWENYPLSIKDHELIFDQLCKDLNISASNTSRENIIWIFYENIGLGFFRQLPLEWLAEQGIDLALYGNGWEKHPRLAQFAKGPAKNGEEVNMILNASKMTYHAMPNMTIHSRIMDAAAARTFIIVKQLKNDAHPIDLIFTPGEDFIYFNERDEFLNKVSYYLSHNEERERIAKNAYLKAQRYSYREFAKSLIDTIAKNPNNIIV